MTHESKYKIEVSTFGKLQDKIEIPKFQRGLVWSKNKKHEFIKTLKSGLPIGVLLLSKKKDSDKYLIVDGLQRFTTMKDYSRDYFSYIEKSEITDTDLMSVILSIPEARSVFDNYTSSAKTEHLELMRNIIADCISHGQNKNATDISIEAATEMCKSIAMFKKDHLIYLIGSICKIIESIFETAKIDEISIPLIIFTGSENELSIIFQKLNDEGVKLSKYDVFAATWINHSVTVKDDPTFIDYIINKYEVSQRESDLEIANYDPEEMKRTGQLTVFEYAFAVGKALMDKCKKLFPKASSPKAESKVDSVGFLLLAELMGLTYQNMGKLAETIDNYQSLDFKKLKDAILESAAFVESSLGPYIESPAKPKANKRTSLACHSELQIASYIIIVFKLKYELTPEGGLVPKSKSKLLSQVREFLPRHYLYDILRSFWAGSGDSKLEEIISEPTTCRYTRDVAKVEFETALSAWLNDGNQRTAANVSAETKLFLNYMLRLNFPFIGKDSYDVEHCVPRDVLDKYFIKKNISVPISCACNLVYIPSPDNRSKGEFTYYQRQKKDPSAFKLDYQQLDLYGYPSKNELSFVEATSSLTEENYRYFLDNRRQYILNKFITTMYK